MNFSIKKIILKNIIKLLLLNRLKLLNNIQSVEMKQNNGLNIKGQYPNNRLHVWNNNNNYINILYKKKNNVFVILLILYLLQNHHNNNRSSSNSFLAGMAGFEPTHVRVKVWCLTTWLHPNV